MKFFLVFFFSFATEKKKVAAFIAKIHIRFFSLHFLHVILPTCTLSSWLSVGSRVCIGTWEPSVLPTLLGKRGLKVIKIFTISTPAATIRKNRNRLLHGGRVRVWFKDWLKNDFTLRCLWFHHEKKQKQGWDWSVMFCFAVQGCEIMLWELVRKQEMRLDLKYCANSS